MVNANVNKTLIWMATSATIVYKSYSVATSVTILISAKYAMTKTTLY